MQTDAKGAKTEVPHVSATADEVSDVLLDFGVDTMPAGSQLLRLASPVFNRMLASGMKEAQHSIIKVDVASKEEFKIFYDLLGPMAWSDDKITEANVESLLTISDYYQVGIMKQACEQSLLRLPPTGNRLIQAQKHGLKTQYERCILYLAKQGTKSDLQVLEEHPALLLAVARKQQDLRQRLKEMMPEIEAFAKHFQQSETCLRVGRRYITGSGVLGQLLKELQ